MARSIVVLLAAVPLLPAFAPWSDAAAETITLIDGSKLAGEVVHAYRGEFTVKTADQEIVLPKGRIRSIAFEAPAPRAIYSTPEKTLEAWRQAATSGDEKGMLEAYALLYQGMAAADMEGMDFRAKSKLLADVSKTKFTVKERKIDKNKAVLTVEQEKDGESQQGEITFVLENGEWKMTP